MSRTTTSARCMAILLMSMAAFSTSCFTPRKAELRRCGKADRLLARAVWLCPDVLVRDSATLLVPAARDHVALHYKDSLDTDSLLAACEQLRAALQYRLDAAHAPRPKFEPSGTAPAAHRATPQMADAVQAIRKQACQWESFTDTVLGMVIEVHNVDGTPMLFVEQLARTVKAPCPPVAQRPPCPTLSDSLRSMGNGLLAIIAALLLMAYLAMRFIVPLFRRR